jgi:DNA-directed RNA polymerase specialized sigma24 family protein
MSNGSRVVIFPFDYEQLPGDQQKAIVPICIASVDRHGNEIARVWFEQGVAPVQEQLRGLARYKLGDIRYVSELAEVTVHKLWEKYGADAGFLPWRRVLVSAAWQARDLAVGGSLWRKKHILPLAHSALDMGWGTDQTEPEEIYVRRLLLERVERRIERQQREDIRQMFFMLREGYTFEEVAQRLGNADPETLRRRFARWIKHNFPRDSAVLRKGPRKQSSTSSPAASQRMP